MAAPPAVVETGGVASMEDVTPGYPEAEDTEDREDVELVRWWRLINGESSGTEIKYFFQHSL